MRIVQVVTLVSPDGAYGGPARVAMNQSAELRRRGHDVTLAGCARGFTVCPTELGTVPVRLFKARNMLPGAGFPGTGSPGLVRWFRTAAVGFDVVHIHFGRDLVSLPMAAIARRHGIPYVLQTHGMVIPSGHPLAPAIDAMWTRKLLRDARAVLYLTQQERDQLLEVARSPLRLMALNNGVPESPAGHERSEPPEVLYVARMHERKRPLVFVEMAKTLLADRVDAVFTLIGPDEGEGSRLREQLQGESRIRWEGSLPPNEIAGRMSKASVYVLPSVREPYPMSVLEAMSVGVPVVLNADCGLAPVVARAGCGVVVDGGAAVFAGAVKSLLADAGLRRRMGDRGQATACADFTMSSVGDRLMSAYR